MGYFNELPNIVYQSPLSHKNSSSDYIVIKNIFRRTKLADYIGSASAAFDKFVIGDGDRPDTVAESLYGDSKLDYVRSNPIFINVTWTGRSLCINLFLPR